MGASVSLILMWLFFFFLALFPAIYVALQTSCEKFSYNLQKRNGA